MQTSTERIEKAKQALLLSLDIKKMYDLTQNVQKEQKEANESYDKMIEKYKLYYKRLPRQSKIEKTDLEKIINETNLTSLKKHTVNQYNDTKRVEELIIGAKIHHGDDGDRCQARESEKTFIKNVISLTENKIKLESEYAEYTKLYGIDTTNIVRNKVNTLIKNENLSSEQKQSNQALSSTQNIPTAIQDLKQEEVKEILKDRAYGTLILPHVGDIRDGWVFVKNVGVESVTALLKNGLQNNIKEIEHIVDHLDLLKSEVLNVIKDNLSEDLEKTHVPYQKREIYKKMREKLGRNEAKEVSSCAIF